jgi:hypothetical protein
MICEFDIENPVIMIKRSRSSQGPRKRYYFLERKYRTNVTQEHVKKILNSQKLYEYIGEHLVAIPEAKAELFLSYVELIDPRLHYLYMKYHRLHDHEVLHDNVFCDCDSGILDDIYNRNSKKHCADIMSCKPYYYLHDFKYIYESTVKFCINVSKINMDQMIKKINLHYTNWIHNPIIGRYQINVLMESPGVTGEKIKYANKIV